jgi:hypothetical protein
MLARRRPIRPDGLAAKFSGSMTQSVQVPLGYWAEAHAEITVLFPKSSVRLPFPFL